MEGSSVMNGSGVPGAYIDERDIILNPIIKAISEKLEPFNYQLYSGGNNNILQNLNFQNLEQR